MSVRVTIRKATERDRKKYDWKPYYVDGYGPLAPWVVTVEGEIYVVMESESKVVFQNNSPAVANLVRMARRYFDSLEDLYNDDRERKRLKLDRRFQETMRKYEETLRWAEEQNRKEKEKGRDANDT